MPTFLEERHPGACVLFRSCPLQSPRLRKRFACGSTYAHKTFRSALSTQRLCTTLQPRSPRRDAEVARQRKTYGIFKTTVLPHQQSMSFNTDRSGNEIELLLGLLAPDPPPSRLGGRSEGDSAQDRPKPCSAPARYRQCHVGSTVGCFHCMPSWQGPSPAVADRRELVPECKSNSFAPPALRYVTRMSESYLIYPTALPIRPIFNATF